MNSPISGTRRRPRLPRLPRRLEPIVFGLVLSGLMSFVVSGVATWRTAGLVPGFGGLWTAAWLAAWLVAFPVVLVAAPAARRMVGLLFNHKAG